MSTVAQGKYFDPFRKAVLYLLFIQKTQMIKKAYFFKNKHQTNLLRMYENKINYI